MADPRLQWKNIVAPNLSAASAAIARANDSFNKGFSGGQNILAAYGAAQQSKADDALMAQIAGLKDEAEFDAFIAGGGLAGLNISDNMRNHVLGMRSTYIADDGTRANTDATRTRNAIALAGEARTAADWQDAVATRDALRENAALGFEAQDYATKHGNTEGGITTSTDLGNIRLMLARTLQTEAGNQGYQGMLDVGAVIRNRVAAGGFGEGIDGVILKPGQFSAWNSVTGYANGEQGQDMNFTPSEEAMRAADAILTGQYTDRTNGATHYYNPAISNPAWANDSFVAIGDHVFGDADGRGVIKGNTGAVNFATDPLNPYVTTSVNPANTYRDALLNSGQFSMADINALLTPITEAGNQQEADQAANDKQVLNEIFSETLRSALLDPENITVDSLAKDLMTSGNLTASEALGLAAQGIQLAQQFPGVLAPEVGGDPALAASVDNSVADAYAALNSTPQARAIADIPRYAEDPAANLAADLGLGQDGENPGFIGGFFGLESGFDQNDLRNMINDYAAQLNVAPEIVAVAMRDAFNRDPFGRNTLGNRFDLDDVEAAVAQLSQEEIRNYREAGSNINLMEAEMRSVQTQAAALRTQIAKAEDGSQKKALQAQLAALDIQIAEIEARRRNTQ